MPKALRHFKIYPVLKIDETVYKQAKSMYMFQFKENHETILTHSVE